jgi:amino acid adenylation domain-containing protein
MHHRYGSTPPLDVHGGREAHPAAATAPVWTAARRRGHLSRAVAATRLVVHLAADIGRYVDGSNWRVPRCSGYPPDRLIWPDCVAVSPPSLGPRMRSVLAAPACTEWAPAAGEGLLGWFAYWLSVTPTAPAVVEGLRTVSYEELDARADRLQASLARYTTAGSAVGVALPRGTATVAMALALARLGARYVPVGTQQPALRLRLLADLADMSYLVADQAVLPTGGADIQGGVATVDPEGLAIDTTALSAAPAVDAEAGASPQSASDGVYGIFTSGSTGTPKLIVVGEPEFVNLLRWYCRVYRFGPGQRASLLVSTTFDVHLMEMWASLVSGSALIVVPDVTRGDPRALLDLFDRQQVTISFLPTPVAEVLDAVDWPASMRLREIQVGGDRLGSLPRPRPGVRWHNLYGPAEATVVTLAADLQEVRAAGEGGPPPIGHPVDGTVVAVVDEDGAVVERGHPGELWLAGACLSRGYAARPDLTASRFVTSTCLEPEAAGTNRLYRTGDLVRMRADGTVDFLGRMDEQIKVRGVRVEPREVEAAIQAHPEVNQCVVVGAGDNSAATGLVAFVVPRGGGCAVGERVGDRVSAHLSAVLPPYLRPDRIVVVPELPQTENGKVDRAALARMATGRASGWQPRPPTVEDVRSKVQLIWADELHSTALRGALSPAGQGDFFASGGTSLAAVRIVARLRDEVGVRIKLGRFMRDRTLDRLVEQVEQLMAETPSRPASGRLGE